MNKENLLIVISSEDKEVLSKFPLLYGSVILPRGYWNKAHIMFWGPSIKLIAQDKQLQKSIKEIQKTGVKMSACVVCVEDYGLVKSIKKQGIKVNHTGELLTKALKSKKWEVLTI